MTNRGDILVVDDSHVSLKLLTGVLTAEGYQVRPADSGELALASVAAKPPELILLDILMPGMDGFEVFRRLREREETRSIPIIFISAATEMEQRVEGLKLGAVDFISKPFEREELLARVHTHVELFRLRARLEHQATALRLLNEQLRSEITDRKHSQEAFEKSEANYRAMFDSMNDAVFVHDPDTGDILDVNRRMCEMYGYTRDEAVRLNVETISVGQPPYAQSEAQQWIRKALEEGPQTFEWICKDKTGRCFWVEVNLKSAPIGGAERILAVVRDITDRKKMEDSLRRNEERFRSLIDQAADAIFVHDFHGRFLEVNRQACTSLGYTRVELLSMSVHDVDPDALPRGDSTKFWPNLPATLEARHRRKDGAIFPVEVRIGAIEYGETKVLLAMARDLTDRKQAEESLREVGAFLDILLNAIPAPVFYKDADGRYIGFNKSYEEFYGKTQQDLLGKSVFDIAPRELAEVYHAKDLELFLNPGIQVYDSQVKDARGAIHDVVFHKSTFSDPQGHVLGLIGVILDITERKRAEDERETLRKQLFQAQKMEAVGTLTGGIAHDFNNLLTIMNGYTELILSERTEDDPIYADLQKIVVTGRKGAELVQRLLVLSKKGEIRPQPLDLNRAVENSSKLMERTFPKMIEIEIVLEKGLGMVNADVSQIEQVVMNLCINAKEAMPEGGRLRIETKNTFVDEQYCRLHPGAKLGRHVLMEISDTGTGMSNETMDRIFDPFFTTKGWDFKKGTGLGLSVAKGIVDQHGGWITCKTEPGKGTTFSLYFPIVEDSSAFQKPEPSPESVRQGEKILLVDDEELVRDLGKRILERAGYMVITAANGKEALELYAREQSKIGLVILDLIMPRMSGEKCLEELFKINPDAKVVVSSGHSLDPNERDRLSGYAKGCVSKPYEVKQLVQTVRWVLDSE